MVFWNRKWKQQLLVFKILVCHAFYSYVTGPSQCFHYSGMHLLFLNLVENSRKLAKNIGAERCFTLS